MSCDLPRFEKCVIAKQTKLPFENSNFRGKTILETFSHYTYFLTFTDDFSRFSWTFLSKIEVFEKFKSWKTLIENENCLKIKNLRTVNSLEFCN